MKREILCVGCMRISLKTNIAQLDGLFTEDGVRKVLEKKDHYAIDMVFLLCGIVN